jgi:cell division protein FtsW (lipid II flippase)
VTHPRRRELLLLGAVTAIFVVGYLQVGSDAAIALGGFLVSFAIIHLGVRTFAPRADALLVPVVAFLVTIGSLQLASIDRLQKASGTPWKSLAPLQAGWEIVGALAFIGILYIFRSGLGPAWRVRYTLALAGLAALLAPMVPGLGYTIRGARLWLRLGPLSFQPGEIAKILIVLFLAAYLSERRELLALPTKRIGFVTVPDPRYLAPLLGLIGFALLVFIRQNDLGSSLLFFLTFMAILWLTTGRAFYPILGIALFAVGVYVSLRAFPHIQPRFDAWLHPFNNPDTTGFQILQGQYALAEGGVSGLGLAGPDAQPNLIPFGWTDLILAAIGHTMGLAGVLAVMAAFILLLTRTFLVALRSRSDLHAIAVSGFAVVTGVQAGLIAGGVTRVLPLTGVTLPFVSYGGSSLLANFAILGCLVAVSSAENTTEPKTTGVEA